MRKLNEDEITFILIVLLPLAIFGFLWFFYDPFYCSQQKFNTTEVWTRCSDYFIK